MKLRVMPAPKPARPDGVIARNAALDVVHAVVSGLEFGDFSPGERLVESELCLRFGIGRQTAREALQHLSARGVVDLAPNRGATIARLSRAEAAQTLEVTELLFGLASRSAARRIADGAPADAILAAVDELDASLGATGPVAFTAARRHFFAALAATAGNAELSRLLEQVRVHVLRAQFGFVTLRRDHARELAAIGRVVQAGDAEQAETMSREHVRGIREHLIET